MDCDFELQTATEALLETFDISKLDYLIQQKLHNGNIEGLQHRVAETLGLEYHSFWQELIFFIMDTVTNNKIELIRLICILTR